MKCCSIKRTAVLLAAVFVALLVLGKTTSLSSYVGTLWSKAKHVAKEQVSTEFEIDRISHELAGLDQKLDQMIRPIAEHKVGVERLRKEVAENEGRLAEQKKVLLDAIAAVKQAKPDGRLVYGTKLWPVDSVKKKIAIDSEAYKRFENQIEVQKKLLESREATLHAAQEQLQAFITKKDEFKLQLAQLKAEHEINKVAAVGSHVEIDETPLAAIAESLKELKDRIERQRTEMEMRKGILEANGIQLNQPQPNTQVDLDAIQAHLEKGAAKAKATSTASNK